MSYDIDMAILGNYKCIYYEAHAKTAAKICGKLNTHLDKQRKE